MSVPSKLDKAKASIVIDHPFFATLLLKKELRKDETIKTAAVDRRGNIYYNEAFFESLTKDQIVFVLAHEVMHVVGQHVNRLGHRNRGVWNIATDAWINDTLKEAEVGEFVAGCVDLPGSKEDTSENIYDKLLSEAKEISNALGDEFKDTGEELTPDQIKKIEAQNKVDIAQAAQAAKMRGKLPGNIARICNAIINVKTPWYDILERYMTSVRNTDNSWKQPNRRFRPHGHYLPIRRSEGTMGEMVIGIDTSGSIGQADLEYFGGHLNRIIELCQPEKVHVVYCDSNVAHVDVFEGEYPVKLEGHGGGGTDMTKIMEWIHENGVEPVVTVVLTDGHTPFPASVDHPTIWAITTNQVAPPEAGETLPICMGD